MWATVMVLLSEPPWWLPKPLHPWPLLVGTAMVGHPGRATPPPPHPPLLGQGGFGHCGGYSGRMRLPDGTADGLPPGFLSPTRHFGCSNNPSFSPRRISPEVQQSSFYGYTGLLPKRYTQGVMTGESKYPLCCPVSTSDRMGLLGGTLLCLLLGSQRVTPGAPLSPAQPSRVASRSRTPQGAPQQTGMFSGF